jgi:GT2 family glycosyltransferase
MNKISVIIPICGGVDKLGPLFDSLNKQTCPPYEILVVDNGPALTKPPELPTGIRYFHNTGNRTLSGNYNLGATHATGDFLLLTQQDCWPATENTLQQLIDAMKPDVVATTSLVKLPKEVFDSYGFWGKVLMAKWVGTTKQGISGKFDLVRKTVFDKIGGYDNDHFRFAGEDVDLCVRLMNEGRLVVTEAEVIHHHHQGNETSAYYVWGKHYMNAEGFGVGLRRHGKKITKVPYATRWSHHLNKFLYPVLLVIPFFPIVTLTLLFVLTNVSQYQSFVAGTPRVVLLLLFNPIIFLTSLCATLIGFARGRQSFKP